ncbi:protein of unknown function [Xenorhabdus poinarii G6]|uniref:Uncharacterized protein n=1 Tax=Xenorhabdus poinarii G6 TaxID=1354304 RepID=A0A068R0E4_9GAMM|nr:protein of unknown function [Xenorhabdus poinarii G6]
MKLLIYLSRGSGLTKAGHPRGTPDTRANPRVFAAQQISLHVVQQKYFRCLKGGELTMDTTTLISHEGRRVIQGGGMRK